jgi:hypothetical protein
MISAKVEGLERLKKKMLALAGPQNEAVMRAANQKNADEFEALVRSIIPRGDPEDGNLVTTLHQTHPSPLATAVGIGSDALPYVYHLETGYTAKDGTHVPGKPFWFPARRVVRKRAHSRIVRAERAVIKSIAAR